MSKTNTFVFKLLLIVAWIIFVGLSIEAGGLIVNFFVSMYEPAFVGNLYQKLNLTELYNENRVAFFISYAFIILIAVLKAFLFYLVIRLMHKMDMSKPFDSFVASQILLIGYCTIGIGLLNYIGRGVTHGMVNDATITGSLQPFWADSKAFILMGAVIYIIGTIFKKGVDIQLENELTV